MSRSNCQQPKESFSNNPESNQQPKGSFSNNRKGSNQPVNPKGLTNQKGKDIL